MTTGRKLVLTILSVAVACGGFEFIRGWRFSRPDYDWETVVMGTYSTEMPAHWTRTNHERHPSLDRDHLLIHSDSSGKDADPYKRTLSITDLGLNDKDIDVFVEERRKRVDSPSRVRDIRLANGVVAKTWTHYISTAEVGIPVRWYVFKGSNAHIYTATHDIPQGWKYAWRFDRLSRRILGSMKFSDAPAPSKPR